MRATKRGVTSLRHYLRALAMGLRRWPMMILAFIGMAIDGGTLLLVPLIVRRAVEIMTAVVPGATAALGRLALWSLALAAVRAGGIYLEIYMQESLGNRIGTDLRRALFQKLLRLPFSFYDRTKTGDIMSRLTKDVDAVRDGTGFVVLITVVNVVILVGALAVMLLLSPALTGVLLLVIPVMLLATAWYSRAARPVYDEIEARSGSLHTVAQENISGIRVVKSFTRAPEECAKFDRENEALLRANLRLASLNSMLNPCLEQMGFFMTLTVLGYGGWLAASSRLSLGGLMAFIGYSQFLYWPIRQTGWLADLVSRALAGARRIFELLDGREQPLGTEHSGHEWSSRGHLVFEHVSFRYEDDDACTLHDFSLDVRPGERVAIIGGTGSGKTTVANLIPRFYDPSGGRVALDGRDLQEWPLESLRRQIGFVFQDNFLFSLAVGDNIALGQSEAPPDVVGRAADDAQIAATVGRLPQGYETVVGERGVGLSGGERQRIALARALLLDPPVLVLDDSTASLDARTEQAVHAALDRRGAGKTMVIVAQRVATAMRADRIIVLVRGRIAEQGTHTQLLAADGVYAALYREQMSLLVPAGGEDRYNVTADARS